MILLDTNVISELMRPRPSAAIESWLARQPDDALYLATVSEAELRYGIAILPASRRRENFRHALTEILEEGFPGRILPFDSAAAAVYAEIAATRRSLGRPISQFDAQLAAIAKSRGAAMATRNTADFEDCGLDLIDPWSAQSR